MSARQPPPPLPARVGALVERAGKELMARDRRPKSLCPWPHVLCRRKPTGRRADLRGPGEHDGAARVGLWKRAGAAAGRGAPPAEHDVFETSREQSSAVRRRAACETSAEISTPHGGKRGYAKHHTLVPSRLVWTHAALCAARSFWWRMENWAIPPPFFLCISGLGGAADKPAPPPTPRPAGTRRCCRNFTPLPPQATSGDGPANPAPRNPSLNRTS